MATQKQIDYIKLLINKMKFENVEYLNKSLDELGGVDEADHQRAIKNYNANCRNWMLDALRINIFDASDLDLQAVIDLYNQRIVELENLDLSTLDNQQASKTIDNLKKLRLV